MSQPRRTRAGTLPSRFSPGGPGGALGVPGLMPANSARVTPSQSPFNSSPSPGVEHQEASGGPSVLLSRLRAGSMPQRREAPNISGSSSPFGPSIFSSWNAPGAGRERASTLASIASVGSNGLSSPAQSQFSKDGTQEPEPHMRTLDYLGLAETPQPVQARLATPYLDYNKASRFRSYSVTNKDKYDDDREDDEADYLANNHYAKLQDQIAATQAAIHSHNLAVQAFVNHASNTRPRARTAGVLDMPGGSLMNSYLAGNIAAPNPLANSDMQRQNDSAYDELPGAVAGMSLHPSGSTTLLSADEPNLDGPTSALWLGGVPTSTTTSTLLEMFKAHGTILSARVLTHKNCGFVNFERVDSAIAAKAALNNKEIFPGAGPIRINFAKPPSASNTPGHDGAFPSPSPDPFSKGQDPSQRPVGSGPSSVPPTSASPSVPSLPDLKSDIIEIVAQFGASDESVLKVAQSVQLSIQFNDFIDEIPPIREPTHTRVYDAPKLRDIRKRIDNSLLSQPEIEDIAQDMLPEIAELASDYLGNTVVQKLFEHCSEQMQDAMLAEVAPHLAEIGCHKNGTWAAQKIIDVCKSPEQMALIVEHLRPYSLPLILDQFGNYVMQGCLKFGSPYTDFIFEVSLSRLWEMAQGRYGARAIRACLESHHATKEQQQMLAAAISLHSVQLATNTNGALLLTWLLDTCTFPKRRTVLAPLLVPHLVHLCTHKVAYLTVLKVINQKAEPEARDAILQALFFSQNDGVLESILSDQACGATLIFKVLTTPFFDESIRVQVIETVKTVLVRIQAQPNQGYKRLMDEVGLSTRGSGAPRESSEPRQQRPASSRQNNANGGQSQQPANAGKQFYNPMGQQQGGFDNGYNGGQRQDNGEAQTAFPAFNQNMMYNTGVQQQAPYQPNMMNRNGPQGGYNYGGMQPAFGGFAPAGPSGDMYQSSPIQPPPMGQMPPGQPGFGPPGFGMAGYGYNNGGMQNMGGYMPQEQMNGRRGRVSLMKASECI